MLQIIQRIKTPLIPNNFKTISILLWQSRIWTINPLNNNNRRLINIKETNIKSSNLLLKYFLNSLLKLKKTKFCINNNSSLNNLNNKMLMHQVNNINSSRRSSSSNNNNNNLQFNHFNNSNYNNNKCYCNNNNSNFNNNNKFLWL